MSQDMLTPPSVQMPSIPLAPPLDSQKSRNDISNTTQLSSDASSLAGSSLAQSNSSPTSSSPTVANPVITGPSILPPFPNAPISPQTAANNSLPSTQAAGFVQSPMPTSTFKIPKFVLIATLILTVAVVSYVFFFGPQKDTIFRQEPSKAPLDAAQLTPNPTCDNACQTNLDCEGRAGGKSVRLECVKESGSSVGKCRNPLCASAVSCTCPAPATPLSQ